MGLRTFCKTCKAELGNLAIVPRCVYRFRQVLPSNLVCEAAVESLTDMGRERREKVVVGGGGGRAVKSADGSNESGAEGITGPLTGGFGSNIKVKTPFLLPRSLPVWPPAGPSTPRLFAGSLPLQPGHPAGPLVISRG